MWYTPKIDWATNEQMDASAWNAIIEDGAYILTAIGRTAQANLILQYVVTQDTTPLYLNRWQLLRTVLVSANEYLGVADITPPGDAINAYELNLMEMLLVSAKTMLDQEGAVMYVGEGYAGEFYAR
jgi:hypothetical protein